MPSVATCRHWTGHTSQQKQNKNQGLDHRLYRVWALCDVWVIEVEGGGAACRIQWGIIPKQSDQLSRPLISSGFSFDFMFHSSSARIGHPLLSCSASSTLLLPPPWWWILFHEHQSAVITSHFQRQLWSCCRPLSGQLVVYLLLSTESFPKEGDLLFFSVLFPLLIFDVRLVLYRIFVLHVLGMNSHLPNALSRLLFELTGWILSCCRMSYHGPPSGLL